MTDYGSCSADVVGKQGVEPRGQLKIAGNRDRLAAGLVRALLTPLSG
jgi:hypothetical protein